MITPEEQAQIIALVRRQVVPAVGCTEPICVALATARATETLGCLPARIEARLSANILKNAMGVGIPGTGMVGLPIAIALGAIAGRSTYGLEVIKDATPEDVERGRRYIDEGRIAISLDSQTREKLYVDVTVTADDGHTARTVIAREHTHVALVEKDGATLLSNPPAGEEPAESAQPMIIISEEAPEAAWDLPGQL